MSWRSESVIVGGVRWCADGFVKKLQWKKQWYAIEEELGEPTSPTAEMCNPVERSVFEA
jgi:hypothetical protein